MPPGRHDNQRRTAANARLRPVVPLLLAIVLLALPLTAGCLTTLAVSAVAGSGAGSEHLDAAKETARDAADAAREKAEDIAESAEDIFESWGSDSQ
jgi:hypothetical protein